MTDQGQKLPPPPATVKSGDKGTAARQVLQRLAELGAIPPAADGDLAAGTIGPEADAAIRAFQASRGLVPDGIVGPRTRAALKMDGGADEIPPRLELPGAALVMIAALRVAERARRAMAAHDPRGSNRGPQVDAYLQGILCARRHAGVPCPSCDGRPGPVRACIGPPWCALFARWCIRQGASALRIPDPLAAFGDLASAWKWKAAGERFRRWRLDPAPGRVGVILVPPAPGASALGHVVLLAGPVLPDGTVWTREGNSGNRVAARRRAAQSFAGFVQID